jgi:NAD(P)-dependent dehydrogenase (short-subunit alcohol dehydrogenase family)
MHQQRVAVVTGGNGGMGQAVVEAMLAAGHLVVVPHRQPNGLAALRERLGPGAAAALFGTTLDLTDEQAVRDYFAQIAATHGGIDLLVNAAGGFGGGEPVHASDWSIWQQQLDINLKTAVIACMGAVPHMIGRGDGAIVNVGSRTATQSGANLAAYAASKRGLMQLTEALAAELHQHRITVNTVMPSVIDTPSNRQAMPNADHDRWVTPAQIARVILFLTGPDARIVSGAHIPVYGDA